MLCALFSSFIILASPEPGYKRFTIGAIIGLDAIRLDTARNGKGKKPPPTSERGFRLLKSLRP